MDQTNQRQLGRADDWSLGVLPNATQSVMITNAGFKAVAIGPNTRTELSTTMTIQALQIASPVDSFNLFMMNFYGFYRPASYQGPTNSMIENLIGIL